ncbi:MAG: hypothetical protein VXW43_19845, partial [Pseudomonadota bacterium]|nr:hypothetical protein [Pseudomonadota bacterium]
MYAASHARAENAGESAAEASAAPSRPLVVTAADVDERCVALARSNAELSGVDVWAARAALVSEGGPLVSEGTAAHGDESGGESGGTSRVVAAPRVPL